MHLRDGKVKHRIYKGRIGDDKYWVVQEKRGRFPFSRWVNMFPRRTHQWQVFMDLDNYLKKRRDET